MKYAWILFAFMPAAPAAAQSFNAPESIEKNVPEESYFIANNGSGEVLKMLPDGSLQLFASGFSAGPHGLELMGDTLYACDGGALRLLNRNTGALIQTVNLGASFLNGITHRGRQLFITDFSAKKIYRFNTLTGAYNVFVTGLSKSPNGIIYDEANDRLVFVSWGSSAPVYALNPADSTVTLLTTTSVGNMDGIAVNCQGDFYISCWSPNSIRFYESDFSSGSVLATTGISSPADIYFDASKDSLYVPNSGSANNVVMLGTPSCIVTGMDRPLETRPVKVFPNPSAGSYTLEALPERASLALYDLAGNLLLQNNVSAGRVSIELGHLAPGIYLLKVASPGGVQTLKIERQ